MAYAFAIASTPGGGAGSGGRARYRAWVRELLLLGLAGALGTMGRYGMSGLVYRWLGDRLPYGTLAVNVLGSFVLGMLMQLALATDLVPRAWRLALTVGFLGAFTTYSTFSYETVRYLEEGAWRPALANVALNLLLGFAAAWGGIAFSRTWMGGA